MFIRRPTTGVLGIIFLMAGSRKRRSARRQNAEAYPLDVFPAPDLLRAHALLQQGGMSLDSISAHVGRHITEGIGKIAREALDAAD